MQQYEKNLSVNSKYIIYLISAFMLITGIIPYFISLVYVLPVADDFCYANDIAKFGGHNLIGIINMIKSFYLYWEGAYYVVITGGGIDPMRRMGFYGINISLLIIMILSFLIIGITIYRSCKLNYEIKEIRFLLSLCILWGCFNGRVMRELIFWYVGACNYTIPLLTGIIGIVCLVKAMKNYDNKLQRIIYCLLSVLAGFLSSGGSLQVAGYVCWIYLLFLGWSIYKKKNYKITLVAFGITCFGAFINAGAPGNYARQSISYEKISVVKAAYYTFVAVANEIQYVFSQTYIPWLMLMIIIVAIIFLKPVKEKLYHPVIVGIVVIISWLISTFPVCYGYADSALAERGYEILDIYIVIGIFFLVNSLANWLKLKGVMLSKEVILTMGFFSAINIGYLQNTVPISELPGIQCWQQIMSGELKRYHDEWIDVYNAIENSEGTIAEIPVSKWAYETDVVIMRPGMSENFEKWVNGGIAIYYGKEKVRVIVQDDIENDE